MINRVSYISVQIYDIKKSLQAHSWYATRTTSATTTETCGILQPVADPIAKTVCLKKVLPE